MRVIRFAMICGVVGVVLAWCAAEQAQAITPPVPVAPSIAKVLYSWTPAPTRADLVTPLAASERKETRLYVSSLSAYIAVPEPAVSYLYAVPSGQCIHAIDTVAATTVDTGGLESAASLSVSTTTDACSGKSLPGAPGNVKAIVQ